MKLNTERNQTLSTTTSLRRKPATAVIMTAIFVKNSIVIKRTELVEKETDSNGPTLGTLKLCLKLPFFDYFWIIRVYNTPGKPLSTEKIFSGKLKIVFVCGDFNAPH